MLSLTTSAMLTLPSQLASPVRCVPGSAVVVVVATGLVVVVVVGLITAYLGIVDAIVSRLAQQIIG